MTVSNPASASGGELAYAEYNGVDLVVPPIGGGLQPITGLQIAIPAGAPAFMLEFYADYQVLATVANGAAIITTQLVDELLAIQENSQYRGVSPSIGQGVTVPVSIKRRMAATAVPKTFTAIFAATTANATATLLGSSGFGQRAYLQAYAR